MSESILPKERELIRAAAMASAPAFAEIWGNPENDVYDDMKLAPPPYPRDVASD
jgi:hypothetical protein